MRHSFIGLATLAVAFAAASLIQSAYLLVRHQWWAAGKGISFGYPFFILCVCGYGLAVARAEPQNRRLPHR